MHVTVLGGNGPTGRLLISQLLEAGHTVTALTRHPEQPGLAGPGVTVLEGDATRDTDIQRALSGAQAVVSVLGTKYSKEPITLYSASATAIVKAMTEQGIRRLIATSSGATSPWQDPNGSWFERHLVMKILDKVGRTLYDDMRRMEAIVAATELDWTIMRPLGLANMEPPTEYAIAEDHIPGSQTARRDLAAAIVDQLGRTDYLGKTVAVATTNKSVSIPGMIWREGIQPRLTKPAP
jgi:putative NADH-flavin reductase